jgi:hypothetical protein
MAVKADTTAETTAETTAATTDTATTEEVVKVIYIGPTLPAGQLKCNSVFEGTTEEIKKSLETVVAKYPSIEKLLVPIGELADKKIKVKTPGNIFYKYYTDILSAASAPVKEG